MSLESQIEIANPQQPHCATILLLDTSGSMAGEKIEQLNQGIQFFLDDVNQDDLARKRVDLALVSFGISVQVEQDFASVDAVIPPQLRADGLTPMGQAILEALDMLEARKDGYKRNGVDYYRPWVFLLTDGEPTDMQPGDDRWQAVRRAIHDGERHGKFLFFAVAVEPADVALLRDLAPPNRPPLQLRPGRFREMFQWLSKSQQRVSMSRVGENVALDNPTGPTGWADIATG